MYGCVLVLLRKPLLLCVEKQLIGEHQQEILDKGERSEAGQLSDYAVAGFESLLESSRYSDLALLFQLFGRFKDGIPMIYRAFGEFIKVCVKADNNITVSALCVVFYTFCRSRDRS